ncbi:hypothetical protein ACJMK2_000408 [Sinanodonta woodiana]|uniref:non-specific serine/threonine protein kinase n=1 Tax=Sinanodonta woodiana TaxID=1069815 RepID=A0ABD3XSP1_SINWO
MDRNSLHLYKKALDAGKEKVYNVRVIVVGQYGVGKTTLIKRLLGQQVDIAERKSTEGIDVHKHCFKISLDKGEWKKQHEGSDELATLHRLNTLLSVLDQKPDIKQKREDIRKVIGDLREITSETEKDVTKSNVPSVTSVSNQEVQSPTRLPIIKGDNIHYVEHLEKVTDLVAVPLVAVPMSGAKSSEREKKKEDAMMEIVRLLNEKADKLVKDIEKYAALSIWDFAGQFAFYTTHQMFLTSRAIYLMVIDLSHKITDIIEGDKCYLDADGAEQRQSLDLVQIWMNSIHSIVRSPNDIIPVILVGTHVDMIREKSRKEIIDKYFNELRYILKDKPIIRHLKDDITIDNTQPDPMLEVLKKRIFELSKEQRHWGEERPARWLPMEQAIMTLKASGTKIVPLRLIEDINMYGSVTIMDRDELELFLTFHHDIGTILYFSVEKLRDNIIIDPHWMIDALKSLITANTFIKQHSEFTKKWYKFTETGKLTHNLIDAIWSEDNKQEFRKNKDLILLLMEQLNIIATPRVFSEKRKETKEEDCFLVPCMLQQKTPEEIISPKPNSQMESSSVLCYVFTGKFLPSAIFHRLVAACIAHWPIAKYTKEHREENLIFCGCCVFEPDRLYELTLLFKEHVIFLRVARMGIKDKTPSSKLCIKVREFITTNLEKIIGYLGEGLKFEYFIQCPEYNGICINSMIPVCELKQYTEVSCKLHRNMIESWKFLDFWFEHQDNNTDGQDEVDGDAPITQEHINHARLCNALTTVCSSALRKILLINVPKPHTDIYQTILANEAKLKKQLNKDHVKLVFPDPQGLTTGKVEEFDTSLLYAIIRNISSITAPSTKWGKPPVDRPRDTTLGANVERIRLYQNKIAANIQDVLCDMESVIGNHGHLKDLEKLKNQVITTHEARELQKKFLEYKREIDAASSDILSTLEETDSALETAKQAVKKLKSAAKKLKR